MRERRLGRWDNAKWFLICCVVFGHVANQFRSGSQITAAVQFWMYLFHMPAFVFIAGMFSKRTIDRLRWTRAVSYGLMYLLMKLLLFAVNVYIKGFSKAKLDFFHENNVPWFALSMCWFLLITMILRNVYMGVVLALSIAAGVMSGYLHYSRSFLAAARTMVFYPFFYMGYKANLQRMERVLSRKWVLIPGQMLLLGSFVYVLLDYDRLSPFWKLFRGRYSYKAIGKKWLITGGGLRLGAYVVSAVLVLALLASMSRRRGFFSKLGERTMAVYVLHFALMRLLIYGIPGCKDWIKGSFTFPKCIALSILILAATSLPVFERMLRTLMGVPEKIVERIWSAGRWLAYRFLHFLH